VFTTGGGDRIRDSESTTFSIGGAAEASAMSRQTPNVGRGGKGPGSIGSGGALSRSSPRASYGDDLEASVAQLELQSTQQQHKPANPVQQAIRQAIQSTQQPTKQQQKQQLHVKQSKSHLSNDSSSQADSIDAATKLDHQLQQKSVSGSGNKPRVGAEVAEQTAGPAAPALAKHAAESPKQQDRQRDETSYPDLQRRLASERGAPASEAPWLRDLTRPLSPFREADAMMKRNKELAVR
jgi:hypothetical protein